MHISSYKEPLRPAHASLIDEACDCLTNQVAVWLETHDIRGFQGCRKLTPWYAGSATVCLLWPAHVPASQSQNSKEVTKWSEYCPQCCLNLPQVQVSNTTVESPESYVQIKIPEEYKDFRDVFSKAKATSLPLHWPYDFASSPSSTSVVLNTGAQPSWGRVEDLQHHLGSLPVPGHTLWSSLCSQCLSVLHKWCFKKLFGKVRYCLHWWHFNLLPWHQNSHRLYMYVQDEYGRKKNVLSPLPL